VIDLYLISSVQTLVMSRILRWDILPVVHGYKKSQYLHVYNPYINK